MQNQQQYTVSQRKYLIGLNNVLTGYVGCLPKDRPNFRGKLLSMCCQFIKPFHPRLHKAVSQRLGYNKEALIRLQANEIPPVLTIWDSFEPIRFETQTNPDVTSFVFKLFFSLLLFYQISMAKQLSYFYIFVLFFVFYLFVSHAMWSTSYYI